MSYFTQQTKVVDLEGGNTVTVRKLTYAERQNVIDRATKVGGNMEAEIHVGRMKLELLCAAVVSWTGPDFEGRPPTAENIGALPPEVADMIAAGADELQAGLTDAEKKA
jgi:hypothetical protein